jgi:hypothetical protein
VQLQGQVRDQVGSGWEDRCCGDADAALSGPWEVARVTGPGSSAGRSRRRDRCFAPPVRGPCSTGRSPSIHSDRSDVACVVGEVVAEGSVAGVSGDPSDVDALAPGVGRPSVDLSCDRAEPTRVAGGDGRSGHAPGQRESSVGLPADCGRGAQARGDGLGDVGAVDFFGVMVWGRLPDVVGQVGWSSCGLKWRARWRRTSSPWRRLG